MTNFAQIAPSTVPGKHNMAADAFQALRTARAEGKPDNQSLSFNDLIDTINPLQHIPVVSSIYRELTGDKISAQARMAGGAIYGGPIGFVTSMAESAIDSVTGNDIGGHIIATLFGDDKDKPAQPANQLATADIPVPPTVETTASLAATPMVSPTQQSQNPTTAATVALAKSEMPPPALPQLSPEAFNALLNSFADPTAAKTANADLATKVTAQMDTAAANEKTASPPEGQSAPANLMNSMSTGLDQLAALKEANAKALSLNSAGKTGLSGF